MTNFIVDHMVQFTKDQPKIKFILLKNTCKPVTVHLTRLYDDVTYVLTEIEVATLIHIHTQLYSLSS